jgi:serine/threonine protein kinase
MTQPREDKEANGAPPPGAPAADESACPFETLSPARDQQATPAATPPPQDNRPPAMYDDRPLPASAALGAEGAISPGAASGSAEGKGYRILQRLGQGSFAQVYRGEAPGGIPVAVKKIIKPIDHQEAQRELQSLELVKKLRHPFLLATHAYWLEGQSQDQLFIVMELADHTLRDRARECRAAGTGVPPDELLRYLSQAAQGLDFLHSQDVLHRDIKPENILLVAGYVKVGDFGLAHILPGEQVSVTGGGTPRYMAPEAWQRDKANRRSDQYSLALTYAELRLGRPPFRGETMLEVMLDHLERAPDLSALPVPEQEVLHKALAKDPGQRYGSCQEFVRALRDALAREAQLAPIPITTDGSGPAPETVNAAGAPTPAASPPPPGVTWSAPGRPVAPTTPAATPPQSASAARVDDPFLTLGSGLPSPPPPAQPAPPPPPRPRRPVLLGAAGAVVVGLVAAGLLWWALKGGHPSDPGATSVALNTERESSEREARGGDPAQSDLPRDVVEHYRQSKRHDFGLKVEMVGGGKWDGETYLLPKGQHTKLFRITVDRDAYVGIWNVAPDQSITQIFPNDYETDHLFRARQTRTVPPGDYSITGDVSTGTELVLVAASTVPWRDLPGDKEGKFLVFNKPEQKRGWAAELRGLRPEAAQGSTERREPRAVADEVLTYKVVPE